MEPQDLIDALLLVLAFGLAVAFWWSMSLRGEVDPELELERTLASRLRHAGITSASAAWFFWATKIALAIILPLVAAEWRDSFPVLLVTGVVGFFLPDLWLRTKIRKRQRRIREGLSFYLDLVTSLLRSGMTVERAFTVGANEGFRDPHPLADEVRLVSRELELGRDREKAFELLGERTGVVELRVMAAAIQVSLRSGASIEDTLESQAELLRYRHQQEAIGRLNRSTAISVAPVFLCGMPLWMVMVFFPAIMDLVELLGEIG